MLPTHYSTSQELKTIDLTLILSLSHPLSTPPRRGCPATTQGPSEGAVGEGQGGGQDPGLSAPHQQASAIHLTPKHTHTYTSHTHQDWRSCISMWTFIVHSWTYNTMYCIHCIVYSVFPVDYASVSTGITCWWANISHLLRAVRVHEFDWLLVIDCPGLEEPGKRAQNRHMSIGENSPCGHWSTRRACSKACRCTWWNVNVTHKQNLLSVHEVNRLYLSCTGLE